MASHIEIVTLLDASGSIEDYYTDFLGSFNEFLARQQSNYERARFSLYTFSSQVMCLVDGENLQRVQPLARDQYVVSGLTALYDAIGIVVTETIQRLQVPPSECLLSKEDVARIPRVIFLVVTDGEDNFSRQWKKNDIRQLVERQRVLYGWEMVFLGVGEWVEETARSLGVKPENIRAFHSARQFSVDAFRIGSDQVSQLRALPMGKS